MLTCIVHHANGSRETVDVEIIDTGSARRFADVSGAEAEAYTARAHTTLGAKRLPQVGEVWRNAVEQLVAVIKVHTTLGGGYTCAALTQGNHGSRSNWYANYVVDLDGRVLRDKSSHPLDLKTYVTRFDS